MFESTGFVRLGADQTIRKLLLIARRASKRTLDCKEERSSLPVFIVHGVVYEIVVEKASFSLLFWPEFTVTFREEHFLARS